MIRTLLLVSFVTLGCPDLLRAAAPALTRTVAQLQSENPTTIVCFGDSVTGVYYHTGGRRAYTDMLGIALQRVYPKAKITMVNAGISGHSTQNGWDRIERDVLRHRPTLVTVMFGLNDMVRVPLDQYRRNLVAIIGKCRDAGAEVLLCTPNNVISTSGRPTEKLEQYCEAMRTVAREQSVPLADCYAALEQDRQRDARAWRLLLSDEIHPNMDGHQRLAEILVQAIAGQDISLDDVPPPAQALLKTSALLASSKPVRVLAMPPYDGWVEAALRMAGSAARIEVVAWPTAGKDLPQLEQDAKERVRPLKPDLVIIAVPSSATAEQWEPFAKSYSWVLNWSLSFGVQEWDCLVVHPSVTSVDRSPHEYDGLVRQLVRAQDLTLVDRPRDDRRPAEAIFIEAIGRAVK